MVCGVYCFQRPGRPVAFLRPQEIASAYCGAALSDCLRLLLAANSIEVTRVAARSKHSRQAGHTSVTIWVVVINNSIVQYLQRKVYIYQRNCMVLWNVVVYYCDHRAI
jgi:hypothetical protein